jgi:phytoene dehydrogenase-like protein
MNRSGAQGVPVTSDYDAIVIGAGHNGLTAAAVMAKGGLRVLCLEKNHFVGGMASTTELIRGYRYELAGSVLFPMPDEVFDALGFADCKTHDLEVMSVNVGRPDQAPMVFYADPVRLLDHIGETNGPDAVAGMAEIAAWCEAPARALGRFEVRTPPKSLDEMFACATNEAERDAIKLAMFGSVMDVVDRFLPDRERHGMLRSMLAFLAVNSTYRGPYDPGSALCLAYAMATTGARMISKLDGGIGALSEQVLRKLEEHGGELRVQTRVEQITTEAGRVTGVRLDDGTTISAPVVVSNLDVGTTLGRFLDRDALPGALAARIDSIDHRAAYLQVHWALSGRPTFIEPWDVLNEGANAANVGMFSSPERIQQDFEAARRGVVPDVPSGGFQIPSLLDPSLAPEGKHAASAFTWGFPIVGDLDVQKRDKDVMAERIVQRIEGIAPDFRDLIERQLVYPSYTYERMFGAPEGDFCHGLIHPELMGPFRPGPRGWPDAPVPYEGLYLCGAGCHGGPGVTFIPGYNAGHAVLDAADRPSVGAAAASA